MAGILALFAGFAMFAEQNGNPLLTTLGVDQSISTTQSGGNMEGKEVRFGAAACGCSPARRRARRPVRSTACTTRSRHSVARRR